MEKLIELIEQKYHPSTIKKEADSLYNMRVITLREYKIIIAFIGKNE